MEYHCKTLQARNGLALKHTYNQVDPNCSYFHELKVLILISGFMVIKNFQECDFFYSSSKIVQSEQSIYLIQCSDWLIFRVILKTCTQKVYDRKS